MSNSAKESNIVKIGDLTAKYKFFVPSYQRGYRWTSEEVNNLLDDLYEFYNSHAGMEDMYCLQPLMLKVREDESYEVIDGQQRLTTAYIILKMINESRNQNLLFASNGSDVFSIEYDTRKGSETYLRDMKLDVAIDDSNIDYYYFTNTKKTFIDWLKQDANTESRLSAISCMLKERTFFIWYELPKTTEQNELFELFKKVNIGKIPLTDGELIKALIINKDNFKENAMKKQEEIAVSWDRIEQGLREDAFWYFFNEYTENDNTRIDVIFELIAKQICKENRFKFPKEEKRFTFWIINKYIAENKENKETVIKELWEKVEFVYATLKFWYQKDDLYHIIGYLIAVNQMDIYQIWDYIADKRKKKQLEILLGYVKQSIVKMNQIDALEYGNTKRSEIRKILLLHNIATIVNKEDKEIRFPFEIMKKRRWDIEHIHAMADSTGEADNSISNLALLDAKINREYKNAVYSDKKEVILQYDKEGRFIPICTKFVFYKLYTPEYEKSKDEYDPELWNEIDKAYYLKDMKSSIGEFLYTFLNEKVKEMSKEYKESRGEEIDYSMIPEEMTSEKLEECLQLMISDKEINNIKDAHDQLTGK